MAAIPTLVVGNGRMGTLICDLLAQEPNFEVVGSVGIENMDQLEGDVFDAELIIDFSNKGMLNVMVDYAKRKRCKLLSGTTGLDEADMQKLYELGETQAVVHAANYSLGVATLRYVSAQAARLLDGWDIEIVETHHNKKVDAPSGTAMALLAEVDPQKEYPVCFGREGMTGERPAREIGVHALRGGTVAGTHEVHFFGSDEELCLTHRATSRQIFVHGAIACAKRLVNAAPGFYSFDELMFNQE